MSAVPPEDLRRVAAFMSLHQIQSDSARILELVAEIEASVVATGERLSLGSQISATRALAAIKAAAQVLARLTL
jgi:hypothetical protein